MSTLIAYWNRTAKRRPLRIAAAIAVCLIGLAALARVPFKVLFLVGARPRGSTSKSRPSATPSPNVAPQAATVSAGGRNENGHDARNGIGKANRAPASIDLAPSAASRVLTGVTQLALAMPETASGSQFSQPRPAEDANSQLLREHFSLLKAGRERFSHMPGYTATLIKQERIGSALLDETSLGIKVRHQPFSAYMKWQSGDDTGKEVLYVDGDNESQLLVRLGGLKGRILPAFKVDPFGSLALRQSRYPITKLGILALADTLIERRELEIREGIVPRVERKADADCDGRPCALYVFEDPDAERSPVYRKSVQYIDRQWNVPLRVANYTWAEPGQHLEGAALDEATLIEYYMYSQIDADVRLSDGDFDRSNAEYRFHR